MERPSIALVDGKEVIIRKSTEYHPSVWGDYFIHNSYLDPQKEYSTQRVEELKERVRILFEETSDVSQTMNLVDSIQLLGLDYHFEKEIVAALRLIYEAADTKNYGLYEVSLRFRLLRQHGYYLSADVFNQFKDDEGRFLSTLNGDAKGLLNLYNAAYLGTHEETILDEAIAFTKRQLESLLGELEQPLASEVSLFLETPLCRRIRRLLVRKYLPIYQENPIRNDNILELAKLDFNSVQSLHREEVKKISMWEPRAVDHVPEYLKDFYLKQLKTCKDFEDELEPEDKYRIPYLQEQIKDLSRSYFQEAKWGVEGYVPSLEEHLRVSLISCGYVAVACASYVGWGEDATKEAFEWLASFPQILKSCSIICRLMDDITSHEREREKDNHMASTVESYMKEYGASSKVACEKLQEMVERAWKDLNKECLCRPTRVARSLIEIIINLSRAMEDIYKDKDTYTNSNTRMKDNVSLLLVESLSI